jgi:hypothetical protein
MLEGRFAFLGLFPKKQAYGLVDIFIPDSIVEQIHMLIVEVADNTG